VPSSPRKAGRAEAPLLTILLAISSDAVAAGEGALQTWREFFALEQQEVNRPGFHREAEPCRAHAALAGDQVVPPEPLAPGAAGLR